MKPPPFGYSRPGTVAEALTTLAVLGEDGKVLAGGQSLVPLLSMRLAVPAHLVDINRLTGLAYVRVTQAGPAQPGPAQPGPAQASPAQASPAQQGSGAAGLPGPLAAGAGAVAVGALARHAQLLADRVAATTQPLLAKALRFVAHPAIRNRGTTVGSVVHADPAGEMTAVLAVLGGTVRLAREGAERVVPAGEFFLGPLESAVRPGELATEVVFPALPPGAGTAFAEVSRRRGDYAVSGVAALVQTSGGTVRAARAAYLSAGPCPVVVDLTEEVAGLPATSADFGAAAALARARVEPRSDIHATAAYRRHLAGVLTQRALREALAEARERASAGPRPGAERHSDTKRFAATEPGPGEEPDGQRC